MHGVSRSRRIREPRSGRHEFGLEQVRTKVYDERNVQRTVTPRCARIAIGRLVISLAMIVVIAVAALAYFTTTRPSPAVESESSLPTTQVLTTASATAPEPSGYSLLTQEPYLLVTPTNHTFVVPFDVTTLNYSISLAYSQADSYAWRFSNGTQWASSSRSCESHASFSTTTVVTKTTTVVTSVTTTTGPPILTHISQVPCGDFPGEWWALNGTLISQNIAISATDVQMTIEPSSIPAHHNGMLNVTLNIGMPPGDYAVFLAVRIQEPDNSNFATALLYLLYYMPVIVSA